MAIDDLTFRAIKKCLAKCSTEQLRELGDEMRRQQGTSGCPSGPNGKDGAAGSGNTMSTSDPISKQTPDEFLDGWSGGGGHYSPVTPHSDHEDSIHYTPDSYKKEYQDDDFERAKANRDKVWDSIKGII